MKAKKAVEKTCGPEGTGDRERLSRWYERETWRGASALAFGRKMPFGKHKGMYMYCLIVRHPLYLDWILENTKFQLTEDEKWWKGKIDGALALYRINRLIGGLAPLMKLGGIDNVENPHSAVE